MRKGTWKPLSDASKNQNRKRVNDLFMSKKNGYGHDKRLITIFFQKEAKVFDYVRSTIQAFGSCIRNDSKIARMTACNRIVCKEILDALVYDMEILRYTTPLDDDVELIEINDDVFNKLNDLLYEVSDEGAIELRKLIKYGSLKNDYRHLLEKIPAKYLRSHENECVDF